MPLRLYTTSIMVPYPFQLGVEASTTISPEVDAAHTVVLKNCRGRIPSLQASRLRTLALEAHNDPRKIAATCSSDDGLTARLVEEAGFPFIFLGGYMVSSSFGLPDTACCARLN
jgi:methylisocitrate lyase